MASATLSFSPSTTDKERYARLRKVSQTLNHKIIDTLPKDAIHVIGKQLGIMQGRTIVMDSEDVLSVLMDCCLYDFINDGKNTIQWYAEQHAPAPDSDEYEILQGSLAACYRLVMPKSRVEGAGIQVVDIVTGEELFIMDFGMSQSPLNIVYGTRTIPFGQFWMTGGAGLPAGRDTVEEAVRRLNEKGLLRDTGFTDPHRATLTIVRTLLEHGASEHVQYQDLPGAKVSNARMPGGHRRTLPLVPGRNSPCICGSGKRYKRCCGQ